MADVTPSALYPLIHDFLSENGLKKTLKAFKKEVDAAKLKKTDGAQSLMDIYKNSLKTNAAKKPETNGKSKKDSSSSSSSSSDSESDEKPKKVEKKAETKTPTKTETKTDNKTPTKKTFASSSSSSDSDSESEKPAKKTETKTPTKTPEKKAEPAKTESAKKKKFESSSSSSSDSDSESEKPAKKTPTKDESSKKRKRDAESENSEHSAKKQKTGSQPTTPKTPFKRIDPEKVKIDGKDSRLFDNSYLAKGGEDYGLKADKDLRNLHGDRFRHEKTKKKKGSYKGGQLSMTVNSVMFTASSEESDSE